VDREPQTREPTYDRHFVYDR
ncbi:pantothenate kinase, partial [Helicobacter pylori]|nr:pantothenate kinase [Helicobacter pylori]